MPSSLGPLNYPLPPSCYAIPHHYRSTPMATQCSSGSTDSNWSNTTSASYQSQSSSQRHQNSRHTSTAQGSSMYPSHEAARSQTSSSQYRVPTSPSDKSDRDSRELQFCPHADCRDSSGHPNRAFTRKADVARHYTSTHDKKYFDCPKHNCNRTGTNGFTRQDHLTEHLRGYHGAVIAKRQHSQSGSSGRY